MFGVLFPVLRIAYGLVYGAFALAFIPFVVYLVAKAIERWERK